MIPITLSWFVCLYLGVFLIGMILLWMGYEVIRRRSEGISNQELVHCRITAISALPNFPTAPPVEA